MTLRRHSTTALGFAALLAATSAQASAPTADEVRDATYSGLQDIEGPVTLANGHWEGEPFVPGGESRPTVHLVNDFVLHGDLNGDGRDEAVVLLAVAAGGTGEFMHAAVVARQDEDLVNVATAYVGDRVMIRKGAIEEGRILLDVLQAGAGDDECCPGELASLGLALKGSELEPFDTGVAPSRLSLEAMAGTEWILRRWTFFEEVPAEPEVTLRYEDGRFAGSSGCNRYSATATDKRGDLPGDIEVGPAMGTKMACPDAEARVERRFLRQLAGASRLGFAAGRLTLSYEIEGRLPKVMVFERRSAE